MRIELVNTGTELMLGRVLNTHQAWLCRQLADHGYRVQRQVAVDDTASAIAEAVREALARTPLVLVTGGLGPTSDDLTRDAIAQLLGRRLQEDPAVLAQIQAWYATRNRTMPREAGVQAQVPTGATVLPNHHGTAPGLLIPVEAGTVTPDAPAAALVMLPGPPRELRPMFTRHVLPWIEQRFPHPIPFHCRTLRTTGVPESIAQQRLAPRLAPWVARGLELGYCARPGEVDIRLAATQSDALALVGEAECEVRAELAGQLYGEEDDTLEAVVIRRLVELQRTVAVAESCTGGRLASRLTDVPGASAVFVGGAVTYSNALKQSVLGVRADTLAAHGAVSEPTAREMAEGARARFQADFALAITGIAGPTGGTPEKPVGTVFIALATPSSTTVTQHLNACDRETFKHMTAQQALERLRQELIR